MSSYPLPLIEIKTALIKKTPERSVEIIKKNAEEGNIYAANIYGDMLIEGVWDIKKMQVDLIRGDLQSPIAEDMSSSAIDPYLLVARNPLKAVEFYKVTANSKEDCATRNLARSKLAHCMIKGYAGFTATEQEHLEPIFRDIEVPASIKTFLAANFKSTPTLPSDFESGNSFVPLPNVRPPVVNPITDVFTHMAARMRDKCLLQILISEVLSVLAFLYCYWRNATIVMGCILACFTLPLVVLTLLNHYRGYKCAVPICSCSKIVAAYQFAIKDLPSDCRPDGDPFEKTPAFIRYSHMIKGLYFWFYVIAAGFRVFLVLLSLYQNLNWLLALESSNPKLIFFIILPFNILVLSLLFVLMEKNISFSHIGQTRDCTDSSNWAYFIIVLILSVISDDKDCELEYKRVTDKKGLDKFIDQLC